MDTVIQLINDKNIKELSKYPLDIVDTLPYEMGLLFQIYTEKFKMKEYRLFPAFGKTDLPWSLIEDHIYWIWDGSGFEIDFLRPEKIKGMKNLSMYKFFVIQILKYELPIPEHFIEIYRDIDDPFCELHLELLQNGTDYLDDHEYHRWFNAFLIFNNIKEFRLIPRETPFFRVPKKEITDIEAQKKKLANYLMRCRVYPNDDDFEEALDAYFNVKEYSFNEYVMVFEEIIKLFDLLEIHIQIKIKNNLKNNYMKILIMNRCETVRNELWDRSVIELVKENWQFPVYEKEFAEKVVNDFPEVRKYVILNILNSLRPEIFFDVFHYDISNEIVDLIKEYL